MEMNKEANKMILEQITFCLIDAIRLYSQLNRSGFNPKQETEWRMCKNALEFTKDSVKTLDTLFDK